MKSQLRIILGALAFVGFQAAYGQNIVLNPGFELNGTDWTFTAASSGSDFNYGNGPAHSGNVSANFGAVGSGSSLSLLDYISQSLPTTSGDEYQVSYWLRTASGDPGAGRGEFLSSFGGTTLQLLNPPGPLFGYTQFTYDIDATSSSTVLEFGGKSVSGYFQLDDVSVVDLGAASAPDAASTLGLLGAAVAGLAGLRRKLA